VLPDLTREGTDYQRNESIYIEDSRGCNRFGYRFFYEEGSLDGVTMLASVGYVSAGGSPAIARPDGFAKAVPAA
jgi:hypothetical protein